MEVIKYFMDIMFTKDSIPCFIIQVCLEIVDVMYAEVVCGLSFI
jgi:hypothetical protein